MRHTCAPLHLGLRCLHHLVQHRSPHQTLRHMHYFYSHAYSEEGAKDDFLENTQHVVRHHLSSRQSVNRAASLPLYLCFCCQTTSWAWNSDLSDISVRQLHGGSIYVPLLNYYLMLARQATGMDGQWRCSVSAAGADGVALWVEETHYRWLWREDNGISDHSV